MKTINKKEIKELADKLLKNPELGYKEFKTKEILVGYLLKNGFKYCGTRYIEDGSPRNAYEYIE